MSLFARPICMLATCLAVLSACSSNPDNQKMLDGLLRRAEFPTPDPLFVKTAEAGAPAHIVAIEARPGAYAHFVRQQVNAKGEETWISGDSLSLGMEKGIVRSTRGLGGDLMAADMTELQQKLAQQDAGVVSIFMSHLTGNDETKISAFRCRMSSRGDRDVDLGVYIAKTQLFQAKCRNPKRAFQNLYWVERRNGEVVQSKQWISPYAGTMTLRKIPIQ